MPASFIHTHHTRRISGFTFLELLVVLVIIGLGWFTLLPKLDLATGKPGGYVNELNAFVEEARQAATKGHAIQRLECALTSDRVRYGEESFTLPAALSEIRLNGERPDGQDFFLQIYPHGGMDAVELTLMNGDVLSAAPLNASFRVQLAEDDTIRGSP